MGAPRSTLPLIPRPRQATLEAAVNLTPNLRRGEAWRRRFARSTTFIRSPISPRFPRGRG